MATTRWHFRAWFPNIQDGEGDMLLVDSWDRDANGMSVSGYWRDMGYNDDKKRYLDEHSAILMQSTGMEDKDGWEIFEGDVVQISSVNGWEAVGPIVWDVEEARWKGDMIRSWKSQDVSLREVWSGCFMAGSSIVGNIYENPELVERKE